MTISTTNDVSAASPEPPPGCSRCPRLRQFRDRNRAAQPAWFNAPVPSFGAANAAFLIVGLAPGLQGANRTGRPFTGDYAGDLLYSTLLRYGFAKGTYEARIDDGLKLAGSRITNAVRCVPPENKPLPIEINACRDYLAATFAGMPKLRAILALGRIAHDSTLKALNRRGAAYPFAHGAVHQLDGVALFDSYHCSRYNTNTGRLTPAMFHAVFDKVRRHLDGG